MKKVTKIIEVPLQLKITWSKITICFVLNIVQNTKQKVSKYIGNLGKRNQVNDIPLILIKENKDLFVHFFFFFLFFSKGKCHTCP